MGLQLEKEAGKVIMQDMETEQIKRIGFFGAYAYDIILYLARILSLSASVARNHFFAV